MKLFALVSAVSAQWATQDGCAADGVSTGSEFNADPFTWFDFFFTRIENYLGNTVGLALIWASQNCTVHHQ